MAVDLGVEGQTRVCAADLDVEARVVFETAPPVDHTVAPGVDGSPEHRLRQLALERPGELAGAASRIALAPDGLSVPPAVQDPAAHDRGGGQHHGVRPNAAEGRSKRDELLHALGPADGCAPRDQSS